MAANQAQSISRRKITVIPTKNIPECISAMMAYRENKSAQINEKAMLKAIENISVSQVTYAVRDTELDGKKIAKGDILGISGGEIKIVGDDPEAVCTELIRAAAGEESEYISVYSGKGVRKQRTEKLQKQLEDEFADMEISVRKGGQPLYYYIISVE